MEKPILFSTTMVQAILEGRKTMTRRIIKPQPDGRGLRTTSVFFEDWHGKEVKTKYKKGDVLWVRENFYKCIDNNDRVYYAATEKPTDTPKRHYKLKPCIYLPRADARIFLKITDVKVERLRDISNGDAVREGIKRLPEVGNHYPDYENKDGIFVTPKGSFSSLWTSINGSGSWDANPWIWVISFERINK
ncbi:MAG: hypothetical protein M0P47_09370 [Bacteroidales bacterium]|nr:hypothetical protein [Bacteroidales bacterium]